MQAYYIPMEPILRDIRHLNVKDQITVIEYAGISLGLAYPYKHVSIRNDLKYTVRRIITPLQEILSRVFRCGVLEYVYIQIKSRGVIYVIR